MPDKLHWLSLNKAPGKKSHGYQSSVPEVATFKRQEEKKISFYKMEFCCFYGNFYTGENRHVFLKYVEENFSKAIFKKWDYNYVSVEFYIEICLRLGNGLEGFLKVPPRYLQILIYGSLYHIYIHSGIFWVKARKIYQFSTYKNLTHLSLQCHDSRLSQGLKAWHRL